MSDIDPLDEAAAAFAGTATEEPEEQGGVEPEPVQASILQDRFGGDGEKAAQAWAEANQHLGRQGSELGQRAAAAEARLQELEAQIAQSQQQPQQDEGYYDEDDIPNLTPEQMQQWMMDKPEEATAFIVGIGQRQTEQRLLAIMDERLAPFQDRAVKSDAELIATSLEKEFGKQTLDEYKNVIDQEVKRDPMLLQGEANVVFQRLKRTVTNAQWERSRATGKGTPTPPRADTRVEGGSSGRPSPAGEVELSPEEQLLAEIAPGGDVLDSLGNRKRGQ